MPSFNDAVDAYGAAWEAWKATVRSGPASLGGDETSQRAKLSGEARDVARTAHEVAVEARKISDDVNVYWANGTGAGADQREAAREAAAAASDYGQGMEELAKHYDEVEASINGGPKPSEGPRFGSEMLATVTDQLTRFTHVWGC